ncbi:hypothetical protein SAMN05660284_02542 [Formivibrio citricus]|uniref:Pyridoxal phosphate homeostasis protein n=1 Tax=Formivibrio citricus TaxID=83765 RepID=A0A1I5D1J9_9NEIS|nr:YggS family pyridoxal phosphate-dependent enzyme [Formivibrio citricus]SFN92761.1 hypothetical protein SAMN05660284_02542 [Formivibrio citricus]
MATLFSAWQGVLQRIGKAAGKAGRVTTDVRLVAVSKTFPADSVRELYALGQRDFGENYVQEFTEKHEALADCPELVWHFIGPLQSNKTRSVAERAHWVHSIERLKIAERLNAQRPADLPPLQVCIQVNVSGEASKSGCEPEDVVALAQAVTALPRLKLRGLMAIPESTEDTDKLAGQFALLRRLRDDLNTHGFELDTLSMGMSGDLELAIAEGATHVRVGTAIFGARDYIKQETQA